MYIAMNRFKVIKGCESDFETVWKTRQSHLSDMKGFVSFYLLKGEANDEHVPYSSHTTWATEEDFVAWTKSDQFRASHARAGDPNRKVLLIGHPQFEGWQTVIVENSGASRAA
jgi:heme-degrading monooxygenase HmoA